MPGIERVEDRSEEVIGLVVRDHLSNWDSLLTVTAVILCVC